MKERLKRNELLVVAIVLSVVAIVLSVIALCRCEPFVFTESALNWALGIIVAIVGIAVSVALVTQIWTAVRISPMIDEKIKDLKEELSQNVRFLRWESKYMLMAHDAQELAQKCLEMGQFNSYIHLSLTAIDALSKFDNKSNCQREIEQLIDTIKICKVNNPDIGLNPKDVEVLVEMIDKIQFPSSKLLREILGLPTDKNYPSLDLQKQRCDKSDKEHPSNI